MVEAKTIGRFEKDKTAFSVPLESVDPALGARVSSGISELDRVLGGGFMRGSAVLLGGEPGIGKSTLLLQACSKLGAKGKALYISGEESAAQIRLRAERIKALSKQIEVFCGNDMHACLSVMDSAHPLIRSLLLWIRSRQCIQRRRGLCQERRTRSNFAPRNSSNGQKAMILLSSL